MIKNTNKQYGAVAILMHWSVAILIIGLFAMGIWMRGLGYYDPWYQQAPLLHKSLGLLVFFILLFKLLWRVYDPAPQPEASLKNWEHQLSRLMHAALYLLPFIIIGSGYLISTADDQGVAFFDLFELPPLFSAFEHQEDIAGEVHEILSWVTIVFVVLHALAALKHHLIDKDATLNRMVRFKKL